MPLTQLNAQLTLFFWLFTLTYTAHAVTFLSFDPRSMAMGGTGVATAKSYNATLFNPALLAATSQEHQVYFVRPYIGARLIDRDDFLDSMDHYKDNDAEQAFELAFDRAKRRLENGTLSSQDLRKVADAASQWLDDVNQLSDKPLRASASYGISFGKTDRHIAWGAHHQAYTVLGAQIKVAARDNRLIQQGIDGLNLLANLEEAILEADIDADLLKQLIKDSIASDQTSDKLKAYLEQPEITELIETLGGTVSSLLEIASSFRNGLPDSFASTIQVEGANVKENSLGAAFTLPNSPAIKLGGNIKAMNIATIDLEKPIEDFEYEDIDERENRREYNSLNFDLGAYYQLSQRIALGAVVKNLLPKDYKTARGNTVRYRPLARLGLAYQHRKLKVAADLDITQNDPLGFDPERRYLGLGAEWQFSRLTALRAGFRTDIHNEEELFSLGLGLGSTRYHADIAIARAGGNDAYGLALQAGLRF